jgi:hypothetical protein
MDLLPHRWYTNKMSEADEKKKAAAEKKAAADEKKRNAAAEKKAVINFVNMSGVISSVSSSFVVMAVNDLKRVTLSDAGKKQVKAAVVVADKRATERNVTLPKEWEWVKSL